MTSLRIFVLDDDRDLAVVLAGLKESSQTVKLVAGE